MSELTTKNKEVICEGCNRPTLIMNWSETNLCPECKKINFIELIDNKNG